MKCPPCKGSLHRECTGEVLGEPCTCEEAHPYPLDANEGARLRDEAVEAVSLHADGVVKIELLESVRQVALEHPRFNTDLVWVNYRERGCPKPREPRVMGAVMREAVAEGYVEITGVLAESDRPEAHRNPKRVWSSLIYREPEPASAERRT